MNGEEIESRELITFFSPLTTHHILSCTFNITPTTVINKSLRPVMINVGGNLIGRIVKWSHPRLKWPVVISFYLHLPHITFFYLVITTT